MKNKKGHKLTEEQKAQRAESRRRNTERCLRNAKAAVKKFQTLEAGNRLLEAEGFQFVICVTDEERQALFEISRRKLAKQHPAISQAAHWALRFALCHPDQLLNWASGIIRYEQAEGLNQFDLVNGKIKLVANHLQEQWVD